MIVKWSYNSQGQQVLTLRSEEYAEQRVLRYLKHHPEKLLEWSRIEPVDVLEAL